MVENPSQQHSSWTSSIQPLICVQSQATVDAQPCHALYTALYHLSSLVIRPFSSWSIITLLFLIHLCFPFILKWSSSQSLCFLFVHQVQGQHWQCLSSLFHLTFPSHLQASFHPCGVQDQVKSCISNFQSPSSLLSSSFCHCHASNICALNHESLRDNSHKQLLTPFHPLSESQVQSTLLPTKRQPHLFHSSVWDILPIWPQRQPSLQQISFLLSQLHLIESINQSLHAFTKPIAFHCGAQKLICLHCSFITLLALHTLQIIWTGWKQRNPQEVLHSHSVCIPVQVPRQTNSTQPSLSLEMGTWQLSKTMTGPISQFVDCFCCKQVCSIACLSRVATTFLGLPTHRVVNAVQWSCWRESPP